MSQDSNHIRVGKNVKVSALAARIIKQLEGQTGPISLEGFGAGAVNGRLKRQPRPGVTDIRWR